MAFKMKYTPNKKTGEGFPYKSKPSPNKFLGRAIRGAVKGLAGGIFGRRGGGVPPSGGTRYAGSGVGPLRPQMSQGSRGGILSGLLGRLRGGVGGSSNAAGSARDMATNASGNVDQFIH